MGLRILARSALFKRLTVCLMVSGVSLHRLVSYVVVLLVFLISCLMCLCSECSAQEMFWSHPHIY